MTEDKSLHRSLSTYGDDSLRGLIHDMRNYIQIASSAVGILSRHEDVLASLSLRSIVANAAETLDRVGALARLSAGTVEGTYDEVSVDEAFTQIASLLHHACGPKIQIRFQMGLVPKIQCNSAALQNALLNIALNAFDAMPSGGTLTISATLAEGPERPEVELAIADTGSGMSRHILERAFDLHFTTKPDGAGHGMGLAGVRNFALRYGGRVFVDSVEGEGSTVTLRLPASWSPGVMS